MHNDAVKEDCIDGWLGVKLQLGTSLRRPGFEPCRCRSLETSLSLSFFGPSFGLKL